MDWHKLSIPEVFDRASTAPPGLSAGAARERLASYGANELAVTARKPAWRIFIGQFADFMILVLIAAAVISGAMGEITDTLIILLIVVVNGVIGFIQEYNAGKALEALNKMAALRADVLRDNQVCRIPSVELVPGDVVLLEAGKTVPADIRLTEVQALRADESALTGESVPVEKIAEALPGNGIELADRTNMVYKNTTITYGRGRGVAVATGMETEMGRIARMLQQAEPPTPLQRRMQEFGRKLSYIILMICLVLFGIGLLRGESPMNMLLVSISLAVAAIPETLPALITISLALGAKQLVRQHALIRKLPAVETLGSVTYICSDKTGTLTQNRMKVVRWEEATSPAGWDFSESPFQVALTISNDVRRTADGSLMGDPTEQALVAFATTRGGTIREFPRLAELPFDARRKCMTTLHSFGDRYLVLSKGAAEIMAGKLVPSEHPEKVAETSAAWSEEGLRVLVFAYRIIDEWPGATPDPSLESDMLFAGIAGLMDPPREESRQAITDCLNAGITPVMITGDHPATAVYIAREIGLAANGEHAVSGKTMQAWDDADFEREVEKVNVYARVTPEQKLAIVHALQRRNHFVAMTGDGVNDAPSLRAADIGIAMGISGTDVSKEAAHMILLDDNFSTIVNAVREGRRIYDNIRKFVKYIMTCNSAEIWTMFLAPFAGLPIPLLPVHILWINLVTDGLPGLALAGERAEKNIMMRPPRPTDESLFAGGTGFHIIWVGLLMAGVTLGVQAYAYLSGMHWQTMVFTVLSLSQLGHVLAIRSEHEYIIHHGLLTNRNLLLTVVITVAMQLAVVYLPEANVLFRTHPLNGKELIICLAASCVVFFAVEAEKWAKRQKSFFRKKTG